MSAYSYLKINWVSKIYSNDLEKRITLYYYGQYENANIKLTNILIVLKKCFWWQFAKLSVQYNFCSWKLVEYNCGVWAHLNIPSIVIYQNTWSVWHMLLCSYFIAYFLKEYNCYFFFISHNRKSFLEQDKTRATTWTVESFE